MKVDHRFRTRLGVSDLTARPVYAEKDDAGGEVSDET